MLILARFYCSQKMIWIKTRKKVLYLKRKHPIKLLNQIHPYCP